MTPHSSTCSCMSFSSSRLYWIVSTQLAPMGFHFTIFHYLHLFLYSFVFLCIFYPPKPHKYKIVFLVNPVGQRDTTPLVFPSPVLNHSISSYMVWQINHYFQKEVDAHCASRECIFMWSRWGLNFLQNHQWISCIFPHRTLANRVHKSNLLWVVLFPNNWKKSRHLELYKYNPTYQWKMIA